MTDAQAKKDLEWFEQRGVYYFVDNNGEIVTRKDREDFLNSNRYDPVFREFIFATQYLN